MLSGRCVRFSSARGGPTASFTKALSIPPPACEGRRGKAEPVGQHALQSTVPILVDVGDQVGVGLGHIGQVTRVLGSGGLREDAMRFGVGRASLAAGWANAGRAVTGGRR